jgi:hypothetical protein
MMMWRSKSQVGVFKGSDVDSTNLSAPKDASGRKHSEDQVLFNLDDHSAMMR